MLPNRSPVSPAETASDLEVLQTDVMRFLAILCLCLVALSTLVLPKDAADATAREADAEPGLTIDAVSRSPGVAERPVAIEPEPVQAVAPDTERAVEAEPSRFVEPDPLQVVEARRSPDDVPDAVDPVDPEPVPESMAGGTAEEADGFTLSFASEEALLVLVDRRQVELYAAVDDRLWQYNPETANFESNAPEVPRYQLERSDLPVQIASRLPAGRGRQVHIGITLPDTTIRAAQALMTQHRGGELVVNEAGQVRRIDPDAGDVP